MGTVKRPPKEALLPLVLRMSDKEIAKIFNVADSTVRTWRRKYDLKPDGSYWPPVECPNCHELVSEYLKNGICMGCASFYRRNGYHRQKPTNTKGGSTGWCKRCHERPAHAYGLCNTCGWHKRNGKSRPRYLIHKDYCKNKACNRPHVPGRWHYGRCQQCHLYLKKHGVERPEHLCKKTAIAWCYCGHKATHLDVKLPVYSADGNERIEKYNLCDDCMALELES